MRSTAVVAIIGLLAGSAWVMRDSPAVRPFLDRVRGDHVPILRDEPGAVATDAVMPALSDKQAVSDNVQQQANAYVGEISAPKVEPLPVERADHFIGRDQLIALLPPDKARALREAPEKPLKADAEVTVGRLPPRPASTITSLDDKPDTAGIATLSLLEPAAGTPLSDGQNDSGAPSVTVADLLSANGSGQADDAIYYVRTVQASDSRGIWGIVVDGLTENFARGIAIRRNQSIDTYQVDIPQQADHRLADQSSSFLGRLIDRKTRDSHVFNFVESRMGRNPDLIFPGQELVIVDFEPQELVAIYRYFVEGESID